MRSKVFLIDSLYFFHIQAWTVPIPPRNILFQLARISSAMTVSYLVPPTSLSVNANQGTTGWPPNRDREPSL